MPPRRRRRLANLANVKTAIADYVRDLEADRIDAVKAKALFYGLSTLAGIITDSDVENRLAALEEAAKEEGR